MRIAERRPDPASAVLGALALAAATALAPISAVAASPPPAAEVRPAPPPPTATVRSELPTPAGAPPTIALTFDDGPDPRWTPEIVAALQRHGAVATFCMIGKQADGHPELVRAVIAAGMRVCDHTHSHDEDLPARPDATRTEEVVGTQHELVAIAGGPVTYYRSPAGKWSPPILELAAGAGMQPLGWSVDPRDWARPGVAAIVVSVQRHVRPGAIVLLHDGGGRRDQTVAALDLLLPWLKERGYRFAFP